MKNIVFDIKEALEKYPDVHFYSLGAKKGRVIVENNQKGLFEIGFKANGDKYIFETTNAVELKPSEFKAIVESQEDIDEFSKGVADVRATIKQLFAEEYEDAITALKDMIISMPSAQHTHKTVDSINESSEPTDTIRTGFGSFLADKLDQFEALEADFRKSFVMFNEDGSIIEDKTFDIDIMESVADEAKAKYNAFKAQIELHTVFSQYLVESFGEDLTAEILETLDMSKNLSVSIPKLAASLKKSGADINSVDFIKTINEALDTYREKQTMFMEDIKADMANPIIPNFTTDEESHSKFLRFNVGVFTVDDLRSLSSELNQAMARLGSITPDDLMIINNWRGQVEYMLHYNQISDRLVKEIIDNFNKRFGKDQSEDFDAESFGFNSTDQMNRGRVYGFASHTPDSEMTPSDGVDDQTPISIGGIELTMNDNVDPLDANGDSILDDDDDATTKKASKKPAKKAKKD